MRTALLSSLKKASSEGSTSTSWSFPGTGVYIVQVMGLTAMSAGDLVLLLAVVYTQIQNSLYSRFRLMHNGVQ